jgi:hypothetical protein
MCIADKAKPARLIFITQLCMLAARHYARSFGMNMILIKADRSGAEIETGIGAT